MADGYLRTAMLATDITADQLRRLPMSDAWMAQEKLDGKRLFIETGATSDALAYYNRNGEPTTLPARTGGLLLPPYSLVDCEWLHPPINRPIALDLLRWSGQDLRPLPAWQRFQFLRATGLEAVRCAELLEDKVALIQALVDEQAEGVIYKYRDGAYYSGRSPECLRDKWRKTADVLIARDLTVATKGFSMTVWPDQPIGRVSARHFWPQVPPGVTAVAEVSYLYASDSYKLVQPTLLRLRDDKRPEQCTRAQLVIGKRFLSAA